MNLTLPQIEQIEKQLESEIAERQALLKSYRAVHAHLARTFSTNTTATISRDGQLFVDHARPLASGGRPYGENTKWVRRAIAAMTRNYTIRDLFQWIHQHQGAVGIEAIATVLARLKENGDITEVQKGRGRRPTIFKAPPIEVPAT